MSCWKLGIVGMSGSVSDSNISLIEDKEALSDRVLFSCSRLDGTFVCMEGFQLLQVVALG